MAEIIATEHPAETAVLFRLSANIPAHYCRSFRSQVEAQEDGLARALFLVMGVQGVHIAEDHVVLTRDPQVIWPLIIPPAINIIASRIKKMNLEVA